MNLPAIKKPDWLPYVLPMAAFMGITSLEGYIPKKGDAIDPTIYLAVYSTKVVVVTLLMFLCRSTWVDLRPRPSVGLIALSAVLGLIITAIWVTIPSPPIPFLGGEQSRAGFDPGTLPGGLKQLFIVVRFFGLVVMVPIFEELFWRSFLWRWFVNQDFDKVEVGAPSGIAAGATSVAFALAHPEWVPALITGLLWAGLVWKTKSLSACVVSHMAANLGLGIYVLATAKWIYW